MSGNQLFNDSYGLQLAPNAVVREIIRFIEDDDKYLYKVIIGTDSLALQDKTADFVTAVVVHRVGNGGRYFWRRAKAGKFYNFQAVAESMHVGSHLADGGMQSLQFGLDRGCGDVLLGDDQRMRQPHAGTPERAAARCTNALEYLPHPEIPISRLRRNGVRTAP